MRSIRRTRQGGKRSGSALVLSLIAVMTVSILAASFLEVSAAVTNRQVRSVDNKQAFYLAEAGLIEAYVGVQLGRTGNVGTPLEPVVFGEGLFWVEAENLDDGTVELECTAMVGGGRTTLSLVIERGEESQASLGVFSSESLQIQEGSLIDGYDSRSGDYEQQVEEGEAAAATRTSSTPTQTQTSKTPQTTTKTSSGNTVGEEVDPDGMSIGMGNVGSNGAITIVSDSSAPTYVYGSVTPGPDQEVTQIGSPTVSGTIEPASVAADLPDVQVPEIELATGVDFADGLTHVLQSGSTGLEHLTVAGSSDLVLQGPAEIVLGSLTLSESSSIVFDTTYGPIDLFVTGDLLLGAGTSVSTTGVDPSQVTVSVSGESEVQLASTASFYGLWYAPAGTVSITSAFELFGAVVADQLSLGAGVRLHFDTYLSEVALELARPMNLSWRIVDFAPVAGATGRGDPFKLLGVDPSTLLAPAESHEDQVLDIKYVDNADLFQRYTGLESAFDWTTVQRLIEGYRDGEPIPTALYGALQTTLIR